MAVEGFEFLGRLKFVFAKTMPDTPHWWTKRTPDTEADFVALYNAIKEHGKFEKWAETGRRYKYWYPGDGYKYWYMGALDDSVIINRAAVDPKLKRR